MRHLDLEHMYDLHDFRYLSSNFHLNGHITQCAEITKTCKTIHIDARSEYKNKVLHAFSVKSTIICTYLHRGQVYNVTFCINYYFLCNTHDLVSRIEHTVHRSEVIKGQC